MGNEIVMQKERTTSKEEEVQSGYCGGKFLTFFLANKEYGLEILKVQEIIGILEITPVPKTPDFIKGVINLRGHIIPIVDLRLKFGMKELEYSEETCIIVVKTSGIIMGIIVDRVSEVIDIAGVDIEKTPSFGVNVNTDYILGIGKTGGKVKLILDIDKVLSEEEVIDMYKMTSPKQNGAETASREN